MHLAICFGEGRGNPISLHMLEKHYVDMEECNPAASELVVDRFGPFFCQICFCLTMGSMPQKYVSFFKSQLTILDLLNDALTQMDI